MKHTDSVEKNELAQRLDALEKRIETFERSKKEQQYPIDRVPSDAAMTIQEAADLVGRPYNTVYYAIKAGTLKAYKYMNRVFVEPEDLETYKKRCEWVDKHTNKKERE